ncbi:MAG: rod shape-determining protein MreC [Bacteroidia bacterium]|nr:rod shape-determining protein MreC [Bacteroidia bacterium]MDW8134406.1 rod shape-determining protein MreC [Bacteroidia bacterium]
MRITSWLQLLLSAPLLWTVLQVIAFYTYVYYTPVAGSTIKRWTMQLTSAFHELFYQVRRPWIALSELERVHKLNSELMEALYLIACSEGPVSLPFGALGDLDFLSSYHFIPAEITYQTFHFRENYAILNKGSRDGVAPGMGVISDRGVVGVIADTTATHSVMLSIFHKEVHVAAYLPQQQVLGITSWREPTLNRLTLEYIPLYVPLSVGDEVWTAANSLIFPKGVKIGRVKQARMDLARGFYNIEIATYLDWHAPGPLYILAPRMPRRS